MLADWPYVRRAGGRDELAWGATADLDVRCLTYRQWRLLRRPGCAACGRETRVRGRCSLHAHALAAIP
jgi:hypothetical protein